MLRRALISYGARFNSTAANAPNWLDVTLPRRQEVLKIPKKQGLKKQQFYNPDLSYLKKAPQTSLAGRLLRPTLYTQKGRAKKRLKRLARIQKRDARLSTESPTPGSTTETEKIEHPNIKSNEPPDITTITQKTERDRERQRKMAARGHELNARIRTVQDNADRLHAHGLILNSPGPLPDDALSPSALKRRQERRLRESRLRQDRQSPSLYEEGSSRSGNSLGPSLNPPGSLPFAQSSEKPSAEIPDNELSPSALKRRQERHLRESGSNQFRQSPGLDKEGSRQSGNRRNSLGPYPNSPGSLPFAQSAQKPSAQIPDDELSPSSLERKREPHLCESGSSQDRQSPRLDEVDNKSGTATHLIDVADLEDITYLEDIADLEEDIADLEEDIADLEEEALPTVQLPEFNGPEPISETMDDDFRIVLYHPFANGHDSLEVSESPSYRLNPNLIDSLVGGDYSGYTSLSSSINNSTSPTALTVVNTAELALSRQRDYTIPQRKDAIEIVKSIVEGKFVQAEE